MLKGGGGHSWTHKAELLYEAIQTGQKAIQLVLYHFVFFKPFST